MAVEAVALDANEVVLVGVAMARYDHRQELLEGERQLRRLKNIFSAGVPLIVDKRENELRTALRTALPKDGYSGGSLVVAWHGHGATGVNRQLLFILPEDSDGSYTYNPEDLASLAAHTRADQILFVLDTCHAGAGTLDVLDRATKIAERAQLDANVWFGVIAASQSYGKTLDGVLISRIVKILTDGPSTAYHRAVWEMNTHIRGTDLIQALLEEWPTEDPDQLARQGTFGGCSRPVFPNPLWGDDERPRLVEHLLLAAQGGDRPYEGWYFSGRKRLLATIAGRVRARKPGVVVVTGSPGSGKSAVLGRIGTLSEPKERTKALGDGAFDQHDAEGDPGPNSIDVNLHLRNKSVETLVRELSDALGGPEADSVEALESWLEGRRRTPVLLLDGLDEAATNAHHIAEAIGRLGQRCCILVSTRAFEWALDVPASRPTLPSRLIGPASIVLDLDDEERETVRADIAAYARKRLVETVADGDLEKMVHEVARIAMEDEQGGDFLLARVLTSRIREDPTIAVDGLDRSLEGAFEADLRRWPELERDGQPVVGGARELLYALAFAFGSGFPARDVWPAVATGLSGSGTNYHEADVLNFIGHYGELHGRYIIAASEGGQAVYRLYHRRLVDYLRNGFKIDDPRAAKVGQVVIDLALSQLVVEA